MKEWSDKELDELFRKSAEEFEPTYEANDWQELRRRLDEADGVTGNSWLKSTAPWLAGLLLLLLAGIGAYYYASSEDSVGIIEKKTVLSAEADVAKGEPDKNEELSQQKIVLNKSEAQEIRVIPEVAQKIEELPRNPVIVSGVRKPTIPTRESGEGAILLSRKAQTLKKDISETRVVGKEKAPEPIEKSIEVKASNAATEENDILIREPDESPTSTAEVWAKTMADDQGRHVAGLVKLAPRPAQLLESVLAYPVPSVPYVTPVSAAESELTTPEVDIPKWSIRLGISPDLSMVDMLEMQQSMKIGPSASLLVDYNISDRWALQTGVIRSLKNYKAMGGEYQWPESWKQKQMPEPNSVDGSCQVFEIPLNLRFDISQKPRGRWFAGAGVSSYKLQKEDYVYNYEDYDPNNMDPWETKSGWAFLSHANVSLGYEHWITKSLSILAEPYAKIPLRGVGHGKVNLFTTGIWFSARYTPVFRK